MHYVSPTWLYNGGLEFIIAWAAIALHLSSSEVRWEIVQNLVEFARTRQIFFSDLLMNADEFVRVDRPSSPGGFFLDTMKQM